jgi:hypothetical protein
MIKFGASGDKGRRLIGLGLSAGNVQRLKEGKPIHLHADEMGFVGDIVIFYGETEDDMVRQLHETMDVVNFRDERDIRKN